MNFYHRTTDEGAAAIIASGFRDTRAEYLTASEFTGVWLSDRPLDINEGCKGQVLLEVILPIDEQELARWEWVEDGKPYKEWLKPAAILNKRGTVSRVL